MSRRAATIQALTLSVCCPYCGESQPAPDNGSDQWMPAQVASEEAKGSPRSCVSCDETFHIHTQSLTVEF